MVPDPLMSFFTASTAAGALVGLVFVAISLSPQEARKGETGSTWRAVAGDAFWAFINAFLVSLIALLPGFNLGWAVLALSLVGLYNTVTLARPLLTPTKNWKHRLTLLLSKRVMVLVSLLIYGAQGYLGIRLCLSPRDTFAVEAVSVILVFVYIVGLTRVWELTGIEQLGLRRWLNPLQSLAPKTSQSEESNEPTSSSHDQQ